MKKKLSSIIGILLIITFAITALGVSSVEVKGIKLDKSSINLDVGKIFTLKVTITPSNATNKKLTFLSGDKSIATVDKNGKIKGIKPGKTVITVTSTSNKKVAAKCNVNVLKVEPVNLLMWSEPVETSFADFGTFTWKKCIEKYKKDTGSVNNIKVVEYPFSGLSEAVLIAIQSGTFPDIYAGSGNRIIPLINYGVIAEVPEGTVSREKWETKAFELGKIRGKQYFIARSTAVFPLIINKALFKKAGVENLIPDEKTRSWSRKNFEKAIKAIGALKNGKYGIAFDLVWNDTDKGNDGFVWADGDAWTDDSYTKATFNTPKSIENFKWIMNIMKSDYVFPNSISVDCMVHVDEFQKGNIGVMCAYLGTEALEIYKKYKDGTCSKDVVDPYYVFFPTDDGSPSKILTLCDGIALKANDDQKKYKAALDFYKWMYDPEKSLLLDALVKMPFPSLLAKGATDKMDLTGKGEVVTLARMGLMEGVKPTITAAAIPGFQQLRKIWHENIQSAFLGKQTPEAARNKMQEEAQKVIDEAKKAIDANKK